MRVIRSSVLKVRETWDMRIRTSDDDAGGGVGVGWVVSSWRLLAGPRWGRIQARIVGGIMMGDAMVLSCTVYRGVVREM